MTKDATLPEVAPLRTACTDNPDQGTVLKTGTATVQEVALEAAPETATALETNTANPEASMANPEASTANPEANMANPEANMALEVNTVEPLVTTRGDMALVAPPAKMIEGAMLALVAMAVISTQGALEDLTTEVMIPFQELDLCQASPIRWINRINRVCMLCL